MKQWGSIRVVLKESKRTALCFLAAILISLNWLIFIWAVQNGFVVESSLGYFINPMLNVLLGVALFRERLHFVQWIAVLVAVAGVLVMTLQTGQFPWIAVTLAISFALYAAVKKKTTMPAVAGLGMETAILAPLSRIAIGCFAYGSQAVQSRDGSTWMLLVLGGPITTLPLVLFAAAAKSVPMAAMGMLQYIAPSIQFAIAVLIFSEKVSMGRAIGFAFVWVALIIFTSFTIASSRSTAIPKAT